MPPIRSGGRQIGDIKGQFSIMGSTCTYYMHTENRRSLEFLASAAE